MGEHRPGRTERGTQRLFGYANGANRLPFTAPIIKASCASAPATLAAASQASARLSGTRKTTPSTRSTAILLRTGAKAGIVARPDALAIAASTPAAGHQGQADDGEPAD